MIDHNRRIIASQYGDDYLDLFEETLKNSEKLSVGVSPSSVSLIDSITSESNVRTRPTPLGTDASAPRINSSLPSTSNLRPQQTAAITSSDTTRSLSRNMTQSGYASSSAPSRARNALDNAAETARNVAKGHGNARTLGILGAAALLGVGAASTRSKKSVPQDQGTYMDESRRRLGY